MLRPEIKFYDCYYYYYKNVPPIQLSVILCCASLSVISGSIFVPFTLTTRNTSPSPSQNLPPSAALTMSLSSRPVDPRSTVCPTSIGGNLMRGLSILTDFSPRSSQNVMSSNAALLRDDASIRRLKFFPCSSVTLLSSASLASFLSWNSTMFRLMKSAT